MTSNTPPRSSASTPFSTLPNPARSDIMRRSSYASVLSGTPAGSTAPRSGFLSHLVDTASTSTPLSQSYPPQSFYAQPADAESSHIASLDQGDSSDRLDRSHFLYERGGYLGAGAGSWVMEPRTPEFFIPSYLRNIRHLERLEKRYKARQQAQKDSRSTRSSIAGSLSTSTSSVNLHKMVPSHRGMTHEIIERPFAQPQEDTIADLPSRWSATEKFANLELSSDGSEVRLGGSIKPDNEGAAVRADKPMPKECGIYYYEVTVVSRHKESQIAVGFSGPKVVSHRMPGWEPDSWAYHGDDGNCFNQTASGKPYAQKFGQSDVIGCGVNFKTGCAFFTRNGHDLGTAFREIRADVLYPSVGFKKMGEHLCVNFGQQPFVFDIDGYVEREKAKLQAEILSEDPSRLHESRKEPLLLQELVAQYLAHDGYVETAKAFATEAQDRSRLLQGSAGTSQFFEYKEDPDAINRHKIRAAILDGDMDRALKLTNAHYPSVLQENENIYFKLRCRKFIEMIRACTELQPVLKRRPSSVKSSRDGVFTNGHRTASSSSSDNEMRQDWDASEDEDEDDDDDDEMEVDDDTSTSAQVKASNLMAEALSYGQDLQSEFKEDPRREVKQALEETFALIAYPDARQSSLAPLLEIEGRAPVAEELNSAILVSLGKSSSAILERLVQQTEVLVGDLGKSGDGAALINVRKDYLR